MEIILVFVIIILYSCLHLLRPPYGVIFDTRTGEYIDSATISLIDARSNKLIDRTISTMDGRYAFFVPKGSYRLEIQRTHFMFVNSFSFTNYIYGNPYKGGVITCLRDSVISVPIIMKQTAPDWNHDQKMTAANKTAGITVLWRKLCLIGAGITTIFSLVMILTQSQELDTTILFIATILWWVLFSLRQLPILGQIRFKNKQPTVSYIDVLGTQNTLIKRIKTNNRGRYWSLIPAGHYTIAIFTQSSPQNNPILLKKFHNVCCDRGFLNKVFFV